MNRNLKRTFVVIVAGAAILALAGAALAYGPGKMGFRGVGPFAGHGNGMMGAGAHGPRAGRGGGLMTGEVVMDAAAEYIGIGETDLMTARHGGKSLAQIATANGKSVTGLEQALVDAVHAHLDKAVAANELTAAQATRALTSFTSHVTTLVDRTGTGPMYGRGGGMGLGRDQGMGDGMR